MKSFEEPTMSKEIEILLKANAKGCLIVEKDSHVLLERDELLAAQQNGDYQEECVLLAPEKQIALSGPFPGCMQIGGARTKTLEYRLVAQTKHFVIFYSADEPVSFLESKSMD
jgi:hypothetical protein